MTFNEYWKTNGIDRGDISANAIARAAWDAATKRAAEIVNQYLVFDSQRAVSWHEIQDCLEKIREQEAKS